MGNLVYLFSGDYCREALSSGILFLSWLQLVPSRHKHSTENGTQLVDHYNYCSEQHDTEMPYGCKWNHVD